jgi:WD40 repeat protein
MGRPGLTKIFISYAHKDGAELAQRLRNSLIAESFDAWLDERRLEAGALWTAEIERAIDDSQVVLALVSPGSYSSEICRAEQLRSLRKGKRVIPLLAASGSDIPLHLEAKQHCDFTGANYASEFQLLVEYILGGAGVVLKNEYRATRLTYVTAPPMVTNYIERPEELRALRDVLFAGRQRQPLALTALAGMGGIGKTVLAHALARDSLVQDAFPDGVVWITIGQEETSDLLASFREVGKALGDDLQRYETLPAAINQYRTMLAHKAVLMVVDDIWSKSDLEPFLADSERSRLLFTTRDVSIARFIGAQEYTANLLSLEQARELVSAWAKLDGKPRPPQLDALIQECGNLPLALSTMGAMLQDATPEEWEDTLRLLRNADLTAIANRLTPGQESFFRTVDVSFRSLAPEMQARYKALAVLLEDMVAPLSILKTLWSVPDAEALRTSRHFVDRSLALRFEDAGAIRLHDLQLDYVRAQHPDREALDLIHAALRLSSHVIAQDPSQFPSQVAGRLLAYVQPVNAVQQLAGSAARAAPRLVHAALCLPLFLIAGRPFWLASRIVTYLRAYVKPIAAVREFASSVVRAAPRPWLRPLQPALYPPGMGLDRTLAGDSDINSVGVTEDGSRVVAASYKTLAVWDLKTGRERFRMAADLGMFARVVVSADGRRAASKSLGGAIHLWDLQAGRELGTLGSDLVFNHSVSISDDGRQVVSATKHTVKVWDCETGRELHALTGHSEDIESVAVSGDGRRAVSASGDNTVKVWDLEAGRELRTFAVDYLSGCHVAVSGNGRRAVCATGSELTMWDLETGRELRCRHDHRSGYDIDAPRLALSWDGRLAVSAAPHDQEVKVWDLETGRELRTLSGNLGGVLDVTVSRDGRLVVTACKDNTLKVWHLGSGREVRPLEGHLRAVASVAASGNGRRAVSVSDDGALRVWDTKTGRQLRTIIDDSKSVAVSFDGRRAVSAWSHKSFLGRLRFGVRVWNVKLGWKVRTLEGHSHSVQVVALSRDGRRAVSASKDLTLKVWDLRAGRELWSLNCESHPVDHLAVSSDGRRAVSTSAEKTLTVWDLDTGRELRTIADEFKRFDAVELTGDGQRAVLASAGTYKLTVWDLERGCELRTWAGHSGPVTGLAVSPDGQWVVSASSDKTVKVWRLSTGELVTTFTCDAPARCCAFGGHDRVVVGDALGRVHFLSLELDEGRSGINS